MNTFGMGLDPFGFGTFDSFHFTDPFELFQRTFDQNASFGMAFTSNCSFIPHGDLMGMGDVTSFSWWISHFAIRRRVD
jgi:hypothetical protein